MAKQTCLRCGQSWHAEVDRPVKCRHCKSHLWNTPRRYKLKVMPQEQPTAVRKARSIASEAARLYGVTQQDLLQALDDFEQEFLYCRPEIRALRSLVRDHFARHNKEQ